MLGWKTADHLDKLQFEGETGAEDRCRNAGRQTLENGNSRFAPDLTWFAYTGGEASAVADHGLRYYRFWDELGEGARDAFAQDIIYARNVPSGCGAFATHTALELG